MAIDTFLLGLKIPSMNAIVGFHDTYVRFTTNAILPSQQVSTFYHRLLGSNL